MIRKLIYGTVLSILIFFSVSFLTVLSQLNTPLSRVGKNYKLSIGFPFEYYDQFLVNYTCLHTSWNIKNLILNCAITWGLTILALMISRKKIGG